MYMDRQFEDGISVVIPTNRNISYLKKSLSSLLDQTLNKSLFEVILVYSGPESAHNFSQEFRSVWLNHGGNLTQLYCADTGASRARNLGIRTANRKYLTFLDDDDYLDPNYLEALLSKSSMNCITITGLNEFAPDTTSKTKASALSHKLEAGKGTSRPLGQASWSLGFNACKSIPTRLIPREGFDEDLKSGEDVVFFAHFLRKSGITAKFLDDYTNSYYNRALTQNSVSRAQETFDFCVDQRLACIKALRNITVAPENLPGLEQLVRSQAGFIERFSKKNPKLRKRIIEAVTEASIPDFPWDVVSSINCNLLFFCYCFPPYADASANVAAKYLLNRNEIADVVCNDMSTVRNQDLDFWQVCKPYIHKQEILRTPTTFANWEGVSVFAEKAVEWAEIQKSYYTEIFSRALWVGSLAAGALYKLKHPEVKWIAELSDPLTVDVQGQIRGGQLTENTTSKTLIDYLKSIGIQPEKTWTLFQLLETVTYVLADEVRFTNENQRKVMASAIPSSLSSTLMKKSVVAQHETPPPTLYALRELNLDLPKDTINIGYFGNFYENRGIQEILDPLRAINSDAAKLTLNVFTSSSNDLTTSYHSDIAKQFLKFHQQLPYLEFLSALTEMDCLLVIDSVSKNYFDLNPFLPSKYSDYRGSGTPIWGIVEEGSPLSNQPLDFRSSTGNIASTESVLREIIMNLSSNQAKEVDLQEDYSGK